MNVGVLYFLFCLPLCDFNVSGNTKNGVPHTSFILYIIKEIKLYKDMV